MGYAKHVGRVGALAVALGVGAAVATTPGIAYAEDTDSGPPPASEPAENTGAEPSTDRPDPGEVIRKRIERTTDNLRKVVTGVVRSSGGALTSTHRNGAGSTTRTVPEVIVEEEGVPENPEPPKGEPQQTTLGAANNDNAPRSFAPPKWQAPLLRPAAEKPAAKALENVKKNVEQSLTALTGNQPRTASTTVERNIFSLPSTTSENQQEISAPMVAPVNVITNVLNAALAPFIGTIPGEPEQPNPVLWAVLGWIRRQFQETLLNDSPRLTYNPQDTEQVVDTATGRPVIKGSVVVDDDDSNEFAYTDSDGLNGGTVVVDDHGNWTYTPPSTWNATGPEPFTDSFTITVSDAADYPHLHGLGGLFRPGGGHTDTEEVTVTIESAASAPEVIQLPEGHSALGSGLGTVGADGKIYRATKFSDNGVDAYALVVQAPGGEAEIIALPGEPIGKPAFGPTGTIYQNIKAPNDTGGYDYAMTVITPAPAGATFALMASNALDTGTNTVPLPGEPVGLMAIGSDGTAYQPIVQPGGNSVAIVLPGRTAAEIVPIPGQLLEAPRTGLSLATSDGVSLVTAGPDGTAYLTTINFSPEPTTTVWRVDANTATAEDIILTGISDNAGATIVADGTEADGTAYIATYTWTRDGDQVSYDTKLWVIAPNSDTATSFELDGQVYGPVAVHDDIAYVTTSRISFDDSIEPTVIWRVDPTGANPPTPIEVEGQPFSSALVAPDGTVYQSVYRQTADNRQQFFVAVVSPDSTTPTLIELGTFSGFFNHPPAMTPQGTVYQVLGNFDLDTFIGDTTVFVINGTTHVAIPLDGAAVEPVVVDANGKAYVVASTNADQETWTADNTLWVISPNSTEPVGGAIDTKGEPVSIAVGGDSVLVTTRRFDPNDPNTLIYEVSGVTIPSQAV
jgi:Bacterial Ig domain